MKQTYLNEKSPKLLIVLMFMSIFCSCGNNVSDQPATSEGFIAIENELKDKFGDQAYYTDLKILYIKGIGNSISTTVTDNPESLKMGDWDLTNNTWSQRSEVTLEVPQGTKAADYMFQLNGRISLAELGELVEKSKAQLTEDKDIEDPILNMAFVKFPKNGDIAKTEYAVRLEPDRGGTTFTFYYTLKGELLKMDF